MKSKFTKEETYYFERMIQYFIESEKREISDLSNPLGNIEYLKNAEYRLKVFSDIKQKVNNLLC